MAEPPWFQDGARERRKFWRLLLVASSMAALVSLLTTGNGLARYVSLPLAWTLALAVQIGLFGLAWLVGTGLRRERLGISLLYAVTMLFSVTFSYVTLQSELSEKIRPAESRRHLLDLTRTAVGEARAVASDGLRQAESLQLRLQSWLRMERQSGWATRVCEAEEHCYLGEVCGRIRGKIEAWERKSRQAYREGPGEQLIYGSLAVEAEALRALTGRLASHGEALGRAEGVFEPAIDNRERLRRLDLLLTGAPRSDLESMLCRELALPVAPAYADHARDVADSGEQPVYAWMDLMAILHSGEALGKEDYPTVFAFFLALFIDLFVLAVALGASYGLQRGEEGARATLDRPPAGWEEELQGQVGHWLDASMLRSEASAAEKRDFLGTVLEAITFDGEGRARLVPDTDAQSRLGQHLVRDRAAEIRRFYHFNRRGWIFVLEDWAHRALARAYVGGS